MKSHRLFGLLSLMIVLALVAACAGAPPAAPAQPAAEQPAAEQPAAKPADDTFKMGLLVPGSANDQGWNQIAYDALLRIEKELGAEISYVELEQNPAAFEKAFRDYASQGYDLVLGHGFEFQDPALIVSKEYPETYFFISSSRIFEGNVIGLNTDSSQPFYLMGVIAAKIGRGAGVVGGMEIPPISEAITGFINGAKSVDPNFPVSSTYIGNFTDAAAAKEAALSMLAEGADVIVPDADVAGLGVYQAVAEAGPGIATFGVFGDFTDKAPANVIGNYFANYGQGIVNIARAVKEGTFKPEGNIEFGLANEDVMWIEYNDAAANPVPEDVRQAVAEAKQKIVAGQVDTLAPAGEGGAAAAPSAEEPGKPFKMGLLVPGSANDQGWNQIAYDALLRIEKELGAEISYVELEQNPAAFEKAFRDYASQGYDLVLGHGFEFQDPALIVSKEYPETYFFISSSRIFEGNVIGLNTDSSQPFYLMGVIAAKIGRGAGVVGGMEIPPISEAITGFINGAKSVDPNFPVSSTYIGNFTDAAAAKEAALSMLAEGADVIVPDADVAGLGVYQAVAEAGPGIATFGVFGDFTDKAPANVIGNYFANYGQGIVNIARAVKEGTFKPEGNIEFGLANEDVMWIEYNDAAANPVPEDVRQAVAEAKQKIVAGQVDTLAPVK